MDPGDVDGLVGGQGAAILHGAADVTALDPVHPDGHQTVIDEDLLARSQLLVELWVGDGHPLLAAHDVVGGQGEGLPRLQGDGLGGKALDTDLGPLGVQNGGHRPAHGVPDRLEPVQPGQMLRVAAVGKVEPGGVHAGADEGAEHILAVHGGTQGADDLGLSHV